MKRKGQAAAASDARAQSACNLLVVCHAVCPAVCRLCAAIASAAGRSACRRTRHSSARKSRPASRAPRAAWPIAASDDAHGLWITLWKTCQSTGWKGRAERSVSAIVLFNEMQTPYKSRTCFQFARPGGRSGGIRLMAPDMWTLLTIPPPRWTPMATRSIVCPASHRYSSHESRKPFFLVGYARR